MCERSFTHTHSKLIISKVFNSLGQAIFVIQGLAKIFRPFNEGAHALLVPFVVLVDQDAFLTF